MGILEFFGGTKMLEGIGHRIKELRDQAGMSQADFGKKLRLSGDQVGKIENNSRRPSDEVLIRLKEEFKVSIDYLYTGTNKETILLPDNMNMNLHTPMAKKAIEELNKMNSCSKAIAKSIQSLDCAAVVGLEFLEIERKKFNKSPEVERIIKMMKMERTVAN